MSWWDFLTQASTPSWLGEKAKWLTPQEQQGFANMLERVKQGIVPPGMQGQQDPSRPFTSEQIRSAIPYITGAAPIAYHGSPHQFEKFSMEKVGTGEGSQVYGHGLYFAENPEVAGTYLQGPRVYKHIETGQTADSRQLSFDQVTSGKWKPQPSRQGHFYQVNIPDEHVDKMLDWDKPLSEQPNIEKLMPQLGFTKTVEGYWQGKYGTTIDPKRMGGEMLMAELGTGERATRILQSLGIPGIKYLDQGSRQAGQGTRNFVVFDENILKDVKRETEGKIAELAGRK
jgi:hypothetical protein